MKTYIYITALGLIVSSLLISCGGGSSEPVEKVGDTVQLGLPDANASKIAWDLFSGTQAGSLLTGHLKTSMNFIEGAARRERVSLMHLRNQSEELQKQMVAESIAAYYRLNEEEYFKRWSVVDLLSELENGNALDMLEEIALSTVPAEKFPFPVASNNKNSKFVQSRELEVRIRLAAVRGIVKLSKVRLLGQSWDLQFKQTIS